MAGRDRGERCGERTGLHSPLFLPFVSFWLSKALYAVGAISVALHACQLHGSCVQVHVQ